MHNVKQISLNGNVINKVAVVYNQNQKAENKAKTVVTVKALEDAINKNKSVCDFEFNKQHETNVAYDEFIYKEKDGDIITDLTYGMETEFVSIITNYNIGTAKTETVYLASKAKKFDDSEVLESVEFSQIKGLFTNTKVVDGKTYYYANYTGDTNCKIIYFNRGYFDSTEGIAFGDGLTSTGAFFIDDNYSIPIDLTDSSQFTNLGNNIYHPNIPIYVVANFNLYIGSTSSDATWIEKYTKGTKDINVMNYCSVTAAPAEVVNTIIVTDNRRNIAFYISDAVSHAVDVICKSVVLNSDFRAYKFDKSRLHIYGTYRTCMINPNIEMYLNLGATGELHITGNFFNGENLDESYTKADEDSYYQFGNYATSAICVFNKICVKRDGELNTAVTDETTLITMLQKIFNTTKTIEFED